MNLNVSDLSNWTGLVIGLVSLIAGGYAVLKRLWRAQQETIEARALTKATMSLMADQVVPLLKKTIELLERQAIG